MPVILPLPAVLRPSEENWWIANASASGGTSSSNVEQVVSNPAGIFQATISYPLTKEAAYLAMSALMAGLDGQSGFVRVGPVDSRRLVRPVNGAARAAVVAKVPLNATSARIRVIEGEALLPGHFFGMNGRLHTVVASADEGDGVYAVNFRPWARPAPGGPLDYPRDAQIILDAPTTVMRLADQESGRIPITNRAKTTVTLNLKEVP